MARSGSHDYRLTTLAHDYWEEGTEMLVRDRMTRNPVSVAPEMVVPEALELLKRNEIRRLPVIGNGKLIGMVTQMDLLRVSPTPATSLAVWEIPALVAKIRVKEVMSRKVITIGPDQPIEDAALLMREKMIGGLPVVDKGELVGIITETDIFDAFVDVLGVKQGGTRITLEVADRIGSLAEVTGLAKDLGINILSLVTLPGEGGWARATFRVKGRRIAELVEEMKSRGLKILHVFPDTDKHTNKTNKRSS